MTNTWTFPNGQIGGTTVSVDDINQLYAQWQPFQPAQGIASAGAPQPHPVPPSDWTEKPGSFYFENDAYAHHFNDRRVSMKAYNLTHNLQPNWSEQQEHKLVDKLWRTWFDEPWPGVQVWTHDVLDIDALPTQSLRKYKLQPFKINYETYQEIKLRLYNTVISIKGNPFWVKQIGNDGANKFKLAVTDGEKTYQVKYDDLQDLRTVPPMYITTSMTGWLTRHPGRVYQQGLNRSNTSLRSPDCEATLANFDPGAFLLGFKKRQNREWTPVFSDLIKSGELTNIRLSDEVAVQHKRNKVIACYKGRALGEIVDNEINLLDEDDALQGWIETAARKVNLELRAG